MSELEHPADATAFGRKIGRPAARALVGASLTEWESLATVRRPECAGLHGVGPAAMRVLDAGLAERGLGWAPARGE